MVQSGGGRSELGADGQRGLVKLSVQTLGVLCIV